MPLVQFTGDKLKMGKFVNPVWVKVLSWVVTILIIGLNGYLLWDAVLST